MGSLFVNAGWREEMTLKLWDFCPVGHLPALCLLFCISFWCLDRVSTNPSNLCRTSINVLMLAQLPHFKKKKILDAPYGIFVGELCLQVAENHKPYKV